MQSRDDKIEKGSIRLLYHSDQFDGPSILSKPQEFLEVDSQSLKSAR